MSWSLRPAELADLPELMSWFPVASAVELWSGPKFRYPFTEETFLADCRWRDFASRVLTDRHEQLAAFGQISDRYDRSHLARLVVHPDLRGQGVGSALMNALIAEVRRLHPYDECGLFVFRHNGAAVNCYRRAGFEIAAYPVNAPMRDSCWYMTRSV